MSAFAEVPVTFAGYRSRAVTNGSGAGRPRPQATVVLLHGWSDSADTFKPLMRSLQGAGADLVALDFPSCGRAQDLQEGPHLPQFTAFAGAALRHYAEAGPVIGVGQSLGGRVLLMAIAADPALNGSAVAGAVAIAPAPMVLPAWQRMLVRNASLASSVSTIQDAATLDGLVAGLVSSFRRTCFVAPEAVDPEVFADYARHYTSERVLRHIESLRRIGAELESPIDLGGLRVNVDLVWGAGDRMAPIAGAADYVKALPRTAFLRLEACGHHAHLERVGDIGSRITAILRTLPHSSSHLP